MVRAGQDCLAPGRLDRLDDARVVGRDENRPDVGFDRAPPDMGDHRLAADVGERLARQAARRHARGDEDDGIDHELTGKVGGKRAYTCCQVARKAANQPRAGVASCPGQSATRRRKLIPDACSRIQQDRARGPGVDLVRHPADRFQQSRFRAQSACGPRLRAADRRDRGGAGRGCSPGAGGAAARAARQGGRQKGRSRTPRSAPPATISTRAARPRSGRIFGALSAARSLRWRASPIPIR